MPSQVIRTFSYDAEGRALLVTFVSGRQYRYEDVPASVIEDMRMAFAKGVFFNRKVRGRYRASPLDA